MPQRKKLRIWFATRNEHKFKELRNMLKPMGIELVQARLRLREALLTKVEEIAELKARQAYEAIGKPVIAEDTGLFVRALNGFPGVLASECFEKIGNEGLLRLMKGVRDRTAEFRCALAYFDGHRLKVFLGRKRGRISDEPRGRGWGFDPIFVPSGSTLTYAELGEEKNRVSHRRLAANKLARWLKSR